MKSRSLHIECLWFCACFFWIVHENTSKRPIPLGVPTVFQHGEETVERNTMPAAHPRTPHSMLVVGLEVLRTGSSIEEQPPQHWMGGMGWGVVTSRPQKLCHDIFYWINREEKTCFFVQKKSDGQNKTTSFFIVCVAPQRLSVLCCFFSCWKTEGFLGGTPGIVPAKNSTPIIDFNTYCYSLALRIECFHTWCARVWRSRCRGPRQSPARGQLLACNAEGGSIHQKPPFLTRTNSQFRTRNLIKRDWILQVPAFHDPLTF